MVRHAQSSLVEESAWTKLRLRVCTFEQFNNARVINNAPSVSCDDYALLHLRRDSAELYDMNYEINAETNKYAILQHMHIVSGWQTATKNLNRSKSDGEYYRWITHRSLRTDDAYKFITCKRFPNTCGSCLLSNFKILYAQSGCYLCTFEYRHLCSFDLLMKLRCLWSMSFSKQMSHCLKKRRKTRWFLKIKLSFKLKRVMDTPQYTRLKPEQHPKIRQLLLYSHHKEKKQSLVRFGVQNVNNKSFGWYITIQMT